MRRAAIFTLLASLSLLTIASGAAWQLTATTPQKMTTCATEWLSGLKPDQLAKAQLDYDAPNRVDWHFIPKDTRKGLQVREMTPEQRKSADKLLAACLSAAGYKKVSTIMDLEIFLKAVQAKKKETTPLRDPERYYFTVFGKPEAGKKWGLSIEGHHMSLNFVVEGEKLLSASPLALCTNPAEVMSSLAESPRTPKGTRVLADEEKIAFELVNSLSDDQKKKAIVADKAPAELREAAQPQPKIEAAAGIADGDLTDKQKSLLGQLLAVYFKNLPNDYADPKMAEVVAGGVNSVHFAWAGPTKPGIGHYYRIQGKTFLIEFVNVQPDAEGNPANHVHCVLRNMSGDFGIALEKK
jgi:Protein of unknown function (DUF3500)